VKFINTDGMAFIGPGSEWFWTALSGIVLAVTFIAIYRQLRMQAGASAVAQLDAFEREAGSERLNQYGVDILVAIRDGTDPAFIPADAAAEIGGVWEKFALLARRGIHDRKLLWEYESDAAQGWWAILEPRARRRRVERGDPRMLENLEWLAGVMAAFDRRVGAPVVDLDYIRRDIDSLIESHEERVRIAVGARTVLYMPVAPTMAPAAASAAPPVEPAPAAASEAVEQH
jgi:hypothetical protein